MYTHGDEITTRKYEGEVYTFYMNEFNSMEFGDSKYITCHTPENCFGYPDIVKVANVWNFDGNGMYCGTKPKAYTMHRYLPHWILKKIEKVIVNLTDKYC